MLKMISKNKVLISIFILILTMSGCGEGKNTEVEQPETGGQSDEKTIIPNEETNESEGEITSVTKKETTESEGETTSETISQSEGESEEGSIETTEQTSTQELKTYENKEYGYSFQYPEGTEFVNIPPNSSDSPQGPVYPFVSALEIRGAENLNSKFAGVDVFMNDNNSTLMDIAKYIQGEEPYVSQNIELNEQTVLEVSNLDSHHLEVYIPYQQKVYILDLINWDGNRNSEDYKFFQTILNSFKIEE